MDGDYFYGPNSCTVTDYTELSGPLNELNYSAVTPLSFVPLPFLLRPLQQSVMPSGNGTFSDLAMLTVAHCLLPSSVLSRAAHFPFYPRVKTQCQLLGAR